MAIRLQSSGTISLGDIRTYIGQSRNMRLSDITSHPYSVNQIFNSLTDSVVPSRNELGLSSMHDKTFGMYKSSDRIEIYSDSYTDNKTWSFQAYLGFGNSGMLYSNNKGFPIYLQFDLSNKQNWNNIQISVKKKGKLSNIGPTEGYESTNWTTIEEILINVNNDGGYV